MYVLKKLAVCVTNLHSTTADAATGKVVIIAQHYSMVMMTGELTSVLLCVVY